MANLLVIEVLLGIRGLRSRVGFSSGNIAEPSTY